MIIVFDMPSTSSVLYYFTAHQLLDLEVAHKNANTVKQGKSAYFLPILIVVTRKYPLRGHILGVLTHTTALDRLWGGDDTLTMWF